MKNLLIKDDEPRDLYPEVVVATVESFGSFVDVKMSLWKSLLKLLKSSEKYDDVKRARLARLVHAFVRAFEPPVKSDTVMFPQFSGEEPVSSRQLLKKQKALFSELWVVLMVTPMTEDLYKTILATLDSEVLPFLSHPVLTVDFCFAAYRMGGHCALLSLKSLFSIATKLNIEVEDFYPKLYALLQPSMFLVQHRNELFELLDMFLRSEYLPQAFAASFAKKMARLALTAPSAGVLIMLQLIFNIIRRHPVLLSLIHKEAQEPELKKQKWRRAEAVDRRTSMKKKDEDEEDDFVGEVEKEEDAEDVREDQAVEVQEPVVKKEIPDAHAPERKVAGFDNDPFDNDTLDPGNTNAMESCLWEILALQNHYIPEIADLALVFSGNMERPLFELPQVSSFSSRTMIERLRKKKVKSVPLEFRAKSVFPKESSWL